MCWEKRKNVQMCQNKSSVHSNLTGRLIILPSSLCVDTCINTKHCYSITVNTKPMLIPAARSFTSSLLFQFDSLIEVNNCWLVLLKRLEEALFKAPHAHCLLNTDGFNIFTALMCNLCYVNTLTPTWNDPVNESCV